MQETSGITANSSEEILNVINYRDFESPLHFTHRIHTSGDAEIEKIIDKASKCSVACSTTDLNVITNSADRISSWISVLEHIKSNIDQLINNHITLIKEKYHLTGSEGEHRGKIGMDVRQDNFRKIRAEMDSKWHILHSLLDNLEQIDCHENILS